MAPFFILPAHGPEVVGFSVEQSQLLLSCTRYNLEGRWPLLELAGGGVIPPLLSTVKQRHSSDFKLDVLSFQTALVSWTRTKQ